MAQVNRLSAFTAVKNYIDYKTSTATGTFDYNDLRNKPRIAGFELEGDQSYAALGLQSKLVAGAGIELDQGNSTISVDFSQIDYDGLLHRPSINGVTITGDYLADEYGLQDKLTAGNNITITPRNVISANIITDYNALMNLPQINGVVLQGNKSLDDLSVQHKLVAGSGININPTTNVITATGGGGGGTTVTGVHHTYVNSELTTTVTNSDSTTVTSNSVVISGGGGGMTEVVHDNTLVGMGTTASPLSVVGSVATMTKLDSIVIDDFYLDDLFFDSASNFENLVTDWTYSDAGIDYSKAENWFYLPAAKKQGKDMFLLAPTTVFADVHETIENAEYRFGMEQYLRQIGVANLQEDYNIYIPKVEQATFPYLRDAESQEELMPLIEGKANSARDAFKYYMENLNGGTPYVLMGHSQGAYQGYFCLRDVVTGPLVSTDVTNLLLKAVLPGMTFTEALLDTIPAYQFSQSKADRRSIVSWNTVFPDDLDVCATWSTAPQRSTNPLSWNEDVNIAVPASENLGATGYVKSMTGLVRITPSGAVTLKDGNRRYLQVFDYAASDFYNPQMQQFAIDSHMSYGHYTDASFFAKNVIEMLKGL